MKLKRNMQKYLYIYYLPSGLFVVVSWVGFLIPPEVSHSSENITLKVLRE